MATQRGVIGCALILRNEVERLFRRLNGCRRICTRSDKLDAMFPGSLNFALFVEMISDLA